MVGGYPASTVWVVAILEVLFVLLAVLAFWKIILAK
jgi:hypothetical protein